MKKRIWKRALAAILASIMVIGLMPDTGADWYWRRSTDCANGCEVGYKPGAFWRRKLDACYKESVGLAHTYILQAF